MKRVFVLIATVALLTALPPQAVANHVVVQDPDDTPGRLDVRTATITGVSPRRAVIKTYDSWRARGIFDRGYLLVFLDTFGGNRFDYYVLLRPEGNNMIGEVWRDAKNGRDFIVAGTQVGRKNRRTIATTIPFRKLRVPDNQVEYRWHVRTIYANKTCYKKVCLDRAPQGTEAVIEPLIPDPV